ncbi:MAG: DUF2249 domain-containing protein, partial [Acidimicrobiales bacterium]
LDEHVKARVAALRRAVATDSAYEPAAAELVAYLAGEVLPHALAEEHTIYRVAAAHAELGSTVTEMIAEHRRLTSAVERLAGAPRGALAVEHAQGIATLFAAHVAKENDILLPALVTDDDVDLAQLLVQMHRLTEAAQEETPTSQDALTLDPEALVLALLLEAVTDLAHTGREDRACRLAASAWAALRVSRPELALRVTAALHRLARLASAEPVVFRSAADALESLSDPELDVRDLAPARRHESIFAAYQALRSGTGFVLVNDHDPKPLRYQFEAEHCGEFTWDYLVAGPREWRVRIGRAGAEVGR